MRRRVRSALYSWLQHRRQYLGQGRVAGHARADQPQHFRLELQILVKLFLPRDALIKLVIRCRLGLGIEAAARRYL